MDMGDGASTNNGAFTTLAPSPTPHSSILSSGDDGGSSDGLLSGTEQVIVSVVVGSSVLLAVLAILVVAVVKLVQFIKSSKKFKVFLADASKAEFSRNGNPLYSPDHPPIQLASYIVKGDLDIKISEECSLKHSHTLGVLQSHTAAAGTIESQGKGTLFPQTNGLHTWEHQNGTDLQSTGMESQEHVNGNGNEVAVCIDSDSSVSQRIQSS